MSGGRRYFSRIDSLVVKKSALMERLPDDRVPNRDDNMLIIHVPMPRNLANQDFGSSSPLLQQSNYFVYHLISTSLATTLRDARCEIHKLLAPNRGGVCAGLSRIRNCKRSHQRQMRK